MIEKPTSHIETMDEISEEQTGLTRECSSTFRNKDNEMTCGLGPCAPNWLQKFASKQSFLVVFCITWVLQGMYHTYFVSAITTIEKLFQIQSKITGIIMSATEIGQIGSSLLLTYYGGQGHRPKWIAWGMVLFAVSSFTCSLPHFIYGRHLINANDLTGIVKDPNICKAKSTPFLEISNITSVTNFTKHNQEDCYEEVITSGYRLAPSVTNIVLAIFFISLLGVGMGQTAVYTLGIPYIDDNVASKESPLYFGFSYPSLLMAKRLLQQLWQSNGSWDDEPPEQIKQLIHFCENVKNRKLTNLARFTYISEIFWHGSKCVLQQVDFN